MTKKDIEGFLSNPFFVALKPEELDVETIYSTFKDVYNECEIRVIDHIYKTILRQYLGLNNLKYEVGNFENDYLNIVKKAMLDFLIQYEALQYFCLNDDYDKVVKIINHKQFNSKVIQGILFRLSVIINRFGLNLPKLVLILNNDINRGITEYNNNYVLKTMGPLKKVIDSITSGVSTRCYIDFYNRPHYSQISDELEQYINNKCGYNTNDIMGVRFSYDTSIEKFLSLAVLNDESFWDFNPNGKNIITFIGFVEKYNDFKHATKIVDYIVDEIIKDRKIKILIDNRIPLTFYNTEEEVIKWSLNRLDVYLSKIVNFKIQEDELKGFLYPGYPNYDSFIQKGNEVFNKFLKKMYPNDYESIKASFENLDYVIQDEEKVDSRTISVRMTIGDILEYHVLGFSDTEIKNTYLSCLYNLDFEKDEYILGRLYYRLYIIDKYAKELSVECIYEYLFEILRVLEEHKKIHNSFVVDTSLRDNSYSKLKEVLAKRNVNISDDYKDLYIISLLDRKYATAEEASKFAEFEQFGDAIYELAVDNILFFNPNNTTSLDHQAREELVKADAQVLVSKKIGLDKAYISKLSEGVNRKYDGYEAIYAGLDNSFNGHFLADSLEMVIGVIAKEFDIRKALEFTYSIILETNSNLSYPKMFENFDPIYLYNESNIDRDYLNKIYPGPFSDDSDYYSEYRNISYALNKLLKIAIIGNDTVEKRKMIAFNSNKLLPNETIYDYYQIVITYLYFGLEETIKKYTAILESSYSEYIK